MDQAVAPLPPIVLAHKPAFRIGPVEVRPETCELLPPDAPAVILEPRVMQVLVALAEARGHVVSRDDLLQRCWPGRIVGDDAVHRVLSRLRHDAERSGGHFRIETITRVGYRLMETDGLGRPSNLTAAAEPPRWNRRTLLLGGGAIAAAGAAGLAFNWSRSPELPPAAAAKIAEGRSASRLGTMQGAATALAAFKAAAALAPEHSEPWSALAVAYAYQANRGDPSQMIASERQARTSIARALAIDPNNSEAHAAEVALDYMNNRPFIEVERRLDAALRQSPESPHLFRVQTYFLAQLGRDRATIEAFDRWLRVEPDLPPVHSAARAYTLWVNGRSDEADRVLAQLMEQWPRHTSVWFSLQKILTYSRRYERALALIDDRANRPLGVPAWNFDLSRQQTLGLANPTEHLDKAIAMTLESARRGSGFAVNATIYFSAVGRVDEAFEVAEAMYFGRGFRVPHQRFTSEQGHFENKRKTTAHLFEPATAAMRADPNFAALTRRLGLADYWRESGIAPDYLA